MGRGGGSGGRSDVAFAFAGLRRLRKLGGTNCPVMTCRISRMDTPSLKAILR